MLTALSVHGATRYVLRIVQACGLVFVGYTLHTPAGEKVNATALAGGAIFTVLPWILDGALTSRTRRSAFEDRLKEALIDFNIHARAHAIVYVRSGWSVFQLSRGKICTNPKHLRNRTREVSPAAKRPYRPNVRPTTTSGAVGRAYQTRRVVAGHFSTDEDLEEFSLALGMDPDEVRAQSFKAALYAVPISSVTEDYSIGAIYVATDDPQHEMDFDGATTDNPTPTEKMRAFKSVLERIAYEVALRA